MDSMPYHFIAWYEALRPLGIRASVFDVYSREGEKWEKTLRELLARSGVNPARKLLRAISARRQKIFKHYFKRFIFKGAREFLLCLQKQGYILALVTGTPRSEVECILSVGLRKLFAAIVTGDSVKRGKPYPDPYLKAASLLKVRPRECLVVENAPLGIKSAKRAGMFCVALTTSLPREYLKAADMVADSLGQIIPVLEGKCLG